MVVVVVLLLVVVVVEYDKSLFFIVRRTIDEELDQIRAEVKSLHHDERSRLEEEKDAILKRIKAEVSYC